MMLDKFDLHILQILRTEARISHQEMADRVGLSNSSCQRRVKALEEEGVISGYSACIDPKKLGLNLTALLGVTMDVHTNERFVHFEEEIRLWPEIIECLLVTGQASDYLLKIQVKDMEAYHDLLLKRISKIPGVSGLHTSFVLRHIKNG